MFLLIDGPSEIYRAIHKRGPNLRSARGMPTKGPYLFTRSLSKILDRFDPDLLAVAMDRPRSLLARTRMFPAYKANRASNRDDEIRYQYRMCVRIVRQLGIVAIELQHWEADDVIASLVNTNAISDDVIIVTRDKDLHQVVSDRVRIFDSVNSEILGPEDVERIWGVPPDKVAEVQTLSGDLSDNVPGVRGIGPKKAAALIREYGSVKELLKNLEDLSPSIQDGLATTNLTRMRKLVTLRSDLTPFARPKDFRFAGLDLERARRLFRALGFRSI